MTPVKFHGIDITAKDQYYRGNEYLAVGKYDDAMKLLTLASDQGHVEARANLAGMYMQGMGVPVDYVKAMKLYQLSAEAGDYASQFGLGSIYMDGKGVNKDPLQALEWYSKALVNDPDKDITMTQIELLMNRELMMNLIISKEHLSSQVDDLKKTLAQKDQEIDMLKTEIDYRPGGKGYKQDEEHFTSLL